MPENRRQFAGLSPSQPLETILTLKGVERLAPKEPGASAGYALRVGNAWYPHMKVTIHPYDLDPGFVLGVATHDHFELPPNSPEIEQVRRLQERNLELARLVVREWEDERLPTQHGLLRRYLEERQAQKAEESSAADAP